MSRLRSSGIQILKKPVNQLLFFPEQMEQVPHSIQENNIIEQLRDTYEKEYMDFIDLAAHELDAPLRKLNILVERLTDKFETVTKNKEAQSYIERIDHCVSDMRALIDELSSLATVMSDKMEYSSCDTGAIMQQVVQSLLVPVNSKKAVITILSMPVIAGDAGQYTRLFRNLLENAIKFTREDSFPEVHVRSSILALQEKDRFKLPLEKIYHKIEIIDNGIGFKNEYAEKIFQPFVRLHGKSKYGGTGIGLAICKKIVQNHSGVIYAEGHEDKGSRFVLLLPETR